MHRRSICSLDLDTILVPRLITRSIWTLRRSNVVILKVSIPSHPQGTKYMTICQLMKYRVGKEVLLYLSLQSEEATLPRADHHHRELYTPEGRVYHLTIFEQVLFQVVRVTVVNRAYLMVVASLVLALR